MEIQGLKKNAAELIVEAADFACLAGLNASDCGINLSASLFLNIRDAMFHFKALCDCKETDTNNILRHYYNLREHLTRGEKDAVIFQVQAVCDAIFEIMQNSQFMSKIGAEERKQLQTLIHSMKDVTLKIRIDGANLSNESALSIKEAWDEVTAYTRKAAQICRENSIPLF